jgi:hypothetical protein
MVFGFAILLIIGLSLYLHSWVPMCMLAAIIILFVACCMADDINDGRAQ